MAGMAHGRSNVTRLCVTHHSRPSYAAVPRYLYTRTLKEKKITGPGLTDMTWTYDYGVLAASWDTECVVSGCTKTRTVNVTDPLGVKNRYIFGNEFRVSEGRLQRTDTGWNGSTALQTTEMFFVDSNAGHPFIDSAGASGAEDGGDSQQNARYRPMNRKVITQQGQTFSWTATKFDSYARATKVTKTGISGTKNETTEYLDNKDKWVLGQVAKLIDDTTGLVIQQNTYDASTANLLTTSHFGLLQQTMSYNADGTLATKKDGLHQTTTFSNYKRGIPQLVTYANSATESAVVNNIGLVTSLTNAAGFTTGIEYDAMGRVKKVTPPEGNPTLIDFVMVNAAEKDIAAGHWRQTVSMCTCALHLCTPNKKLFLKISLIYMS